MSELLKSGLQVAGEVAIGQLTLVGSTGTYISLADYFIEFNLYESIYNNVLSGDVVISDSRNLISYLPIKGEELLIVNFETPSIKAPISKTFRVYKIENRKIAKDRNTQVYSLKFASIEAFVDSASPIFEPYTGKPTQIAKKIFDKYLKVARSTSIDSSGSKFQSTDEKTELQVLHEASNDITFVTPGWTPKIGRAHV